jgi:hypothetical protein
MDMDAHTHIDMRKAAMNTHHHHQRSPRPRCPRNQQQCTMTSMQCRRTLLEKYLLLLRHHAIGIGSVGGRRARRMPCVGLDLHLHPHQGLVLVLVLRSTRVREPERGRVLVVSLVRGRAMMDMGRRRSSLTSLVVRVPCTSVVYVC